MATDWSQYIDQAPVNSAVKQVESGGDPNAVSDVGALGTMQTMPGTLTDPGFGVTPARNNSPEEMQRVGQDYLQAMLHRYPNVDDALAAYNWGPGNVDKWIAAGSDPSALPKETQKYITKIHKQLDAQNKEQPNTPTTPQADPWAQYAESQTKDGIHTKDVPPSFWNEFKAALTDHPLDTIMNDNLFVNIGHGIGRIAGDILLDHKGVAQEMAQELHDAWNKDIQTVQKFSWDEFKKNLKDHPGAVAAGFVNSIIADPEMAAIPVGFGGKFADTVGEAAAKYGTTLAKVAAVGARATESAAVGAGLNADITFAEQFKTGNYDLQDVWTQAKLGGAFGALFGLRGLKEDPALLKKVSSKMPDVPVEDTPAAGIIPTSLVDVPHVADKIPAFLKVPYQTIPAFLEKAEVAPTKPTVPAFLETKALPKPEAKSFIVAPDGTVHPNYTETPTPKTKLVRGQKIGMTPEEEAAFYESKMRVAEAVAPANRTLEDLLYVRHRVAPEARIILPGEAPTPSGEAIVTSRPSNVKSGRAIQRAQKMRKEQTSTIGYNLPPAQRGMAQADILKYLGIFSAGAVAGNWLDPQHPEASAMLGGIAAASGLLAVRQIGKVAKGMWKPMIVGAGVGSYLLSDKDKKKSHPIEGAMVGAAAAAGFKHLTKTKTDANVRIADGLIWENLNHKAEYARNIWSIKTAMDRDVPLGDRQANITRFLDGSQHTPLTAAENGVADQAREFFRETGEAAKAAGVVKELRDNYVTHIIDWTKSSPSEVTATRNAILSDLQVKSRTFSTTSRYGKARTYDTIDELNGVLSKYGVKLKTENISEIVSIYGNSMRKAIEDRNLISALKEMKDVNGRPLIDTPDRNNTDYVYVPHPALQAFRVHPQLADSLRFLVDNHIGPITNGLYFVTMLAKTMEVAANFFHARSLLDVAIGAGVGRTGLKSILSGVPGLKRLVKEPTVLDTYRKGSLNDDISLLIRKGLKAQLPQDVSAEAVNSPMDQIGRWVDNTFFQGAKAVGHVTDKVIKANNKLHQITWEHGYTGIKLTVAMKEMQRALEENARARTQDPSIPVLTKEQAAEKAASFANDMTGGVDWFGLAKNTESQLMHKIAMTSFSQRGRLWMQIGMFAPDWTFATFRSVYKALPGVTKDAQLRRMYRRYVVRSLMWYMGLANLANYTFTGHYIWGNKDWTTVELGDGRKMYLSKHTMEFFHWMQKPGQVVWNKLGIIPSEVLEQKEKKEFLSASGTAPDMGDPLSHALKKFIPLPGQQMLEGTVAGGISSFLGSPIYGEKTATREAKKREKALRLSDFGRKGIGSLTGGK